MMALVMRQYLPNSNTGMCGKPHTQTVANGREISASMRRATLRSAKVLTIGPPIEGSMSFTHNGMTRGLKCRGESADHACRASDVCGDVGGLRRGVGAAR